MNPGGGADYTALETCINAHEGTLSEPLIINCSGSTEDTATVTVHNYTTTAINNIQVNGNNTTGKFSTSHYRIVTSGKAISIPWFVYIQFTRAQIVSTDNNAFDSYSYNANAAEYIFDSCVIAANTSQGALYAVANVTARIFTLRNCLVYDYSGAASGKGFYSYGALTWNIDNCTVCGFTTGMATEGGDQVWNMRNNIFNGNGTDFGTTVDSHSNNISEDNTSPDTTLRGIAVSFVDEANKDFHLAATEENAIDAGIDLSATFTTDIDGETRSGTWDIGADEYVSAEESSETMGTIYENVY